MSNPANFNFLFVHNPAPPLYNSPNLLAFFSLVSGFICCFLKMCCLPRVSTRLHSRPHLALGGVKNISLNLTIANAGDDAYDTNIYFNFSREVFYINFWQKVRPSSCS